MADGPRARVQVHARAQYMHEINACTSTVAQYMHVGTMCMPFGGNESGGTTVSELQQSGSHGRVLGFWDDSKIWKLYAHLPAPCSRGK